MAIAPLLDYCAETVAKKFTFNEIEAQLNDLGIPGHHVLRHICRFVTPSNERELRIMITCLEDFDYIWERAHWLLGGVHNVQQIGFNTTGSICGGAHVSIYSQKQQLNSVWCSFHDKKLCENVVAVLLFKIRNPSCVTTFAPVTEELDVLSKQELQKVIQFAICNQDVSFVNSLFTHIRDLKNPESIISTSAGPPDRSICEDESVSVWNDIIEQIPSTFFHDCFCIPHGRFKMRLNSLMKPIRHLVKITNGGPDPGFEMLINLFRFVKTNFVRVRNASPADINSQLRLLRILRALEQVVAFYLWEHPTLFEKYKPQINDITKSTFNIESFICPTHEAADSFYRFASDMDGLVLREYSNELEILLGQEVQYSQTIPLSVPSLNSLLTNNESIVVSNYNEPLRTMMFRYNHMFFCDKKESVRLGLKIILNLIAVTAGLVYTSVIVPLTENTSGVPRRKMPSVSLRQSITNPVYSDVDRQRVFALSDIVLNIYSHELRPDKTVDKECVDIVYKGVIRCMELLEQLCLMDNITRNVDEITNTLIFHATILKELCTRYPHTFVRTNGKYYAWYSGTPASTLASFIILSNQPGVPLIKRVEAVKYTLGENYNNITDTFVYGFWRSTYQHLICQTMFVLTRPASKRVTDERHTMINSILEGCIVSPDQPRHLQDRMMVVCIEVRKLVLPTRRQIRKVTKHCYWFALLRIADHCMRSHVVSGIPFSEVTAFDTIMQSSLKGRPGMTITYVFQNLQDIVRHYDHCWSKHLPEKVFKIRHELFSHMGWRDDNICSQIEAIDGTFLRSLKRIIANEAQTLNKDVALCQVLLTKVCCDHRNRLKMAPDLIASDTCLTVSERVRVRVRVRVRG